MDGSHRLRQERVGMRMATEAGLHPSGPPVTVARLLRASHLAMLPAVYAKAKGRARKRPRELIH